MQIPSTKIHFNELPTKRLLSRITAFLMAIIFVVTPFQLASGAIIGTGQVIGYEVRSLLLDSDVSARLAEMGVSQAMIEQRLNHMTPAELADLQQNLNNLPAGEGVIEILVLFLIIFIVTDILGVTDIFPFIRPLR